MAQTVKNLPAIGKPKVWSLGWEDTLEKGTATHFQYSGYPLPVFWPGEFCEQRSLADYSPWNCKVRHDWVTNNFTMREPVRCHRWFKAAIPNIFYTRDQFHRRKFFHRLRIRDSFGMIQEHCIYCTLYFYYYYISSTSDHQALDPGGWEPLV